MKRLLCAVSVVFLCLIFRDVPAHKTKNALSTKILKIPLNFFGLSLISRVEGKFFLLLLIIFDFGCQFSVSFVDFDLVISDFDVVVVEILLVRFLVRIQKSKVEIDKCGHNKNSRRPIRFVNNLKIMARRSSVNEQFFENPMNMLLYKYTIDIQINFRT